MDPVTDFDFDPFSLDPYGGFWILLMSLALLGVAFGLSRIRGLGLERELIVASVRGFLQIMAIGMILLAVFKLEDASVAIAMMAFLASMVAFATYTSSRRAKDLPRSPQVTIWGIMMATVVTLGIMVSIRILPLRPEFIIPVGGMVVGNSMNACSLALNRLMAEVRAHRGTIEARLLLGADPTTALRPHMRSSVRSSMIPTVDSLKTLGIVFIPGGMTGMVLGGVDPVWAAEYQLVIFFMILCGSVISTVVSTSLARRHLVTVDGALVNLPEVEE